MTFVQKELLYDNGGDKMQLEIPDNKWLKGEYVKDKGIGELKILDEGKAVNGDFGFKVETKVSYEGQTDDSPNTISWNLTSVKILEKIFGKETKDWIGKTIPIESSRTEKGYAIYPDEKLLGKVSQ